MPLNFLILASCATALGYLFTLRPGGVAGCTTLAVPCWICALCWICATLAPPCWICAREAEASDLFRLLSSNNNGIIGYHKQSTGALAKLHGRRTKLYMESPHLAKKIKHTNIRLQGLVPLFKIAGTRAFTSKKSEKTIILGVPCPHSSLGNINRNRFPVW